MKIPAAAFVTLLLAASLARAEVRLPALFSDHMVIQSGGLVPVWGTADPDEEITVSLGKRLQSTRAGADGKWMVNLPKLKPGGEALTLTVKGKNTLTVNDVLVGEVWLASGQSNMEFPFHNGGYSEAVHEEANLPQLRMFTVKRQSTRSPRQECEGAWVVCNPKSVESFSAVAYFFGQELHQALKVPVGLIASSWGGTDIASWTSEEAQAKVPELKSKLDAWKTSQEHYDAAKAKEQWDKDMAQWKEQAAKAKAEGAQPPRRPLLRVQPDLDPNHPANLYNGMIAPLIPYAFQGVIWYQGEHNCGSLESAKLYATQLPLLVEDWRARWGRELPFAWVQLPNFEQKGFRPVVREAMLKSLKVKNTGMAVTIDIGEANNNHPKNKAEVSRRLSLWALGTVYHEEVPSISGPVPLLREVHGDHIAVTFDHADEGLVAKGGQLKGFQIAGEDKVWKTAVAKIAGAEVLISHPEITKPVAARYAWAANPEANLYNGAGLPATPFRTDDWDPTPAP